MTDPAAAAAAARVQAAFERVHRDRMAGLPFVNEALRVELVGLRRWQGRWLGVLVTPWSMNLMLLPADDAPEGTPPWPRLATGEFAEFAFPAGVLSFLGGREGEAGEYLTCSLFSPVFEFADQAAARQMAEACLLALLDPQAAAAQAAPAREPQPSLSRRRFLGGAGDAARTAEP
jgi:[NiFe] hydrogenase assembly HybE family chaperone